MRWLARLQLVGPSALFVATVAAEGATSALAYAPSSQELWYLNLRWFGAFQKSHYIISSYVSADYFQLFWIALPLFFIACCGFALKRPFLLAVASNLSLVYAGFLPYCWYVSDRSPKQVSLGMIMPAGADDSVCLFLLIACIFSVGVSHTYYFFALRRR